MEDYGTLKTLLFGNVNRKLIVEQWDEMRRVASSIRHGTVSASLLMRKLAAYPRQNQVVRALTEFGNSHLHRRRDVPSRISARCVCKRRKRVHENAGTEDLSFKPPFWGLSYIGPECPFMETIAG